MQRGLTRIRLRAALQLIAAGLMTIVTSTGCAMNSTETPPSVIVPQLNFPMRAKFRITSDLSNAGVTESFC